MALIEFKLGGGTRKDFDPAEAEDLKLHVRACQRRYESLDRKLSQVIAIGGVLIVLYLMAEPGSLSKLIFLLRDAL